MSHHLLSHHSKVGPDRCLLDLRPYGPKAHGPKGLEHDVAAGKAQRIDAQAPAAEVVEELLAQLGRFEDVLEAGEPEERKAVVRAFLQGIRVEKTTRQAVLRWYRLPRPSFLKMVELRGLEPLTPRLPALCSPN